ncbi:MAG: hypothetical protein JRG73_10900 [Deltaproteobacteria bacterium]|nr:hypothetical protein [Deltaproteobacteria bacterium]
MKKRMLFLVLLSVFVATSLYTFTASAVVRLKWGATSVRSNGYGICVILAKAVNQAYRKEIQMTVVETGGWVGLSCPLHVFTWRMASGSTGCHFFKHWTGPGFSHLSAEQ